MDVYREKRKCRLCKEEFITATKAGRKCAEKELYLFVCGIEPQDPLSPPELCVHYCKNGSMGVSDFIGWERCENG